MGKSAKHALAPRKIPGIPDQRPEGEREAERERDRQREETTKSIPYSKERKQRGSKNLGTYLKSLQMIPSQGATIGRDPPKDLRHLTISQVCS